MWRRWIALAVAVAAAVGIALIPVFIHRSSSPRPARSWIDRLSFGPNAVATASNGEQFLVHRQRGTRDGICFTLGSGGGATCDPRSPSLWEGPLMGKHIALIGRTRDRRGIAWWGLVGDDVRTVRAQFENQSTRRFDVRHGFVVFGNPVSITALDTSGAAVGRIDKTDQPTLDCTLDAGGSTCSGIAFAQG